MPLHSPQSPGQPPTRLAWSWVAALAGGRARAPRQAVTVAYDRGACVEWPLERRHLKTLGHLFQRCSFEFLLFKCYFFVCLF